MDSELRPEVRIGDEEGEPEVYRQINSILDEMKKLPVYDHKVARVRNNDTDHYHADILLEELVNLLAEAHPMHVRRQVKEITGRWRGVIKWFHHPYTRWYQSPAKDP